MRPPVSQRLHDLSWFIKTDSESPAFRPGRMCAPSMGAILEVKVLPRADHSERREAQLREGD